jgi:hypothetical protein
VKEIDGSVFVVAKCPPDFDLDIGSAQRGGAPAAGFSALPPGAAEISAFRLH